MLRVGLSIALFCMASSAGFAEPVKKPDSGAQQALRKAQAMLQQLAEEKAHLEEERKKLEGRVKELETQASRAEALDVQLENQRRALESSQQHNLELTSRINSDVTRMRGMGQKYRDLQQYAQKVKQDNQMLVSAVKERTEWIDKCSDNNKKFFEANSELIEKYANKGFWDSFKQAEALTQIGSVKLENELQEYQFKLEDLLVTPYQESAELQQPPSAADQTQGLGDEDLEEIDPPSKEGSSSDGQAQGVSAPSQ